MRAASIADNVYYYGLEVRYAHMTSVRWALLAVLLAVLAAGGLVFLFYSNEIGRARAAVDRGALIAATTAGPIEYADIGDGVPLLSIHGAGGGWDQGLANVADLVGEGFRVIAPSRFGYLGTPVPSDGSPSAQADAHASLLGELDIDKAVVVGVSAGARSAAELAIRYPEKVSALLLIVPGTYSADSEVAAAPDSRRGSGLIFWLINFGADFAWWMTEKIAPSVLIRFVGVPPELVADSDEERARIMTIVRSVQPLSRRLAGLNIDASFEPRRLSLEEIKAPTLILSTKDDLFNTLPAAQYAADTIPDARLVVYETGGHMLVGHHDDARELIHGFFDSAGIERRH